jgi:flagellar basal body-associated protein FliL
VEEQEMVDLVEEIQDEKEKGEKNSAEKKGFLTRKKIVIIALVLAVVGSAFPVLKMMSSGKGEELKPEPVLYKLDEQIMVGVKGTSHTRTLACRVSLKLESPEMVAELDSRKDEFVDLLMQILQKYPIEDLDFIGQNKIRRDIQDEFNLQLNKGKVLQVLFTQFLIR